MLYNKMLFLDVETSPSLAYVWKLFKENVPLDRLIAEGEILTFSVAFGDDKPICYTRNMFLTYRAFLNHLRKHLDAADIVVGHNLNKFDIPIINAAFLREGVEPPSPYRKIDTLLEARRNFRFISNKLQHIAKLLGVEEKAGHSGFELWERCMRGDPQAFIEMAIYNDQDVVVVREVYKKMRPWMQNHPNMNLFVDGGDVCPKCGSHKVHYRGYAHTAVAKYHRFVCLDCGGWGRGIVQANEKVQVRNIV